MSDDTFDGDVLDEDVLDDELDGELDGELDAEDIADELLAGDDAAEDDDGDDALFDDEDEDTEAAPAAEPAVPLDASEDGDDETDGEPAVDLTAIDGLDVDDPVEAAREVEGDADDTIREGEFVCRSCHMAKRASALADADEMLCRDCV